MFSRFPFFLYCLFLFIWYPGLVRAFDFYSDLEKKAVVEIEVYRDSTERDPIHQGSGFFIDYRGCAATSAHILYNHEDAESQQKLFGQYKILRSSNPVSEPDQSWRAKVEYLDKKRDVALICVENPDGRFFHPLSILEDSSYGNSRFGDELMLGGYPQIGGKTPTFSPGYVLGFWEKPDLADFLKVNLFADEDMYLIKTNAASGPGGSGSAALNVQHQVLGMIFAASVSPSGVSFLVSSKTLNLSLKDYESKKDIGGTDCLYDYTSGLYQKDKELFYDRDCQYKRNKNIEDLVAINYQERCGAALETKRLYQASRYIASRSSLDSWWQYLMELCPLKKAALQKQTLANPPIQLYQTPVFAYGKPRGSLEEEQKASAVLKTELGKRLGKNKIRIAPANWHKLVNAYVYGGYPVESLKQLLIIGGKTVHPSIPWEKWKESKDYKDYIKKRR